MKFTLLAILAFTFFAFQMGHSPKGSWARKINKQFAHVPSGLVVVGKDTGSVQAFYISKTEVTNKEYKLFLADLKAQNRLEEYALCLPDTNAWSTRLKNQFGSKYQEYYFSHPAYVDYPVVCVSFEAAQKYCEWYTIQMNKKFEGKKTLIFRLPYREEFLRACRGDVYVQKFAWKENDVWNKDSLILCNHLHYDESPVSGSVSDNADVTAPAKSYWPNQFGVYNLNGNVAEMTNKKGIATGGSWRNEAKDVTNESIMNYETANPMVGFRMVTTYVNMSCPAK
ncbi:MAG: formylglycine-generating enzyme family protein [Flavobacteriia bacterium]|jgi:sulfatase modifying factor 1